MLMTLGNMMIQLAQGKWFAFRDARNVQLECTEGKVWLTIEGVNDDFLLGKGDRIRIDSNGLTLVQGFPSGSVQVDNDAVISDRG